MPVRSSTEETGSDEGDDSYQDGLSQLILQINVFDTVFSINENNIIPLISRNVIPPPV